MKISFHRTFEAKIKQLPDKQKQKIKEAIKLYLDNPRHPKLRLHQLSGKWKNYYSISAGGDLRIHFRKSKEDSILFVIVGTHSQLYK